jgi:GAF domain-containing protein
VPYNEPSRLQALCALHILDSSSDVRFNCITRFAAEKLEVPICLITLIDANRQWFKSACGIEAREIPRDLSICAHAICETTNNHPRGRVYEITETFDDSRFFDNPQVTGDPWIRSYISFVLKSESGMNIGTLCLVDTRPRKFGDDEIDLIIELGLMAEELMNGRSFSNKSIN